MNAPFTGVSPGIEQTSHVYIGNFLNSNSGPTGRIAIADHVLTPQSNLAKLHTTPVHEFFHLIQSKGYLGGWSTYEAISEGLASLAEQMVSWENFQYSMQDMSRTNFISTPHQPGMYSYSLLYRYMAEQLIGYPGVQGGLVQDYAMDVLLVYINCGV